MDRLFRETFRKFPLGNGVLDGRWDIGQDLKIDAEAHFTAAQLTAGSLGLGPYVAFGPGGAPLAATFGGSIGGDRSIGNFDLALHGALDRTVYENVTYDDGETQKLSLNDFDDWALRGRITYRSGGSLRPFAEIGVDTRRYADGLDQYGYERELNGFVARLGAEVDLAERLTGSASLGYGERFYEDPRLPHLASPLVGALLVWNASGLTTVTLKSTTALAETTIRGASGAAEFASTLEIAHALRRYLTLTAALTQANDLYTGVPLRDLRQRLE